MNDEEKKLFEKMKKLTQEYPEDLIRGTRAEFSFNAKRMKKSRGKFSCGTIAIIIMLVIVLAVLARYFF